MAPSRSGARRRRLVFCSGAVPVLLIAVLALYRPDFYARIDDSVYDVQMRSADTGDPSPQIVIVDIDERSLSTIGQWPWPRDVMARLIERLRAMGAATVALDIIFAEADRYATVAAGRRSPDDVLAETLRDGRVILGYGLTFDAGSPAVSRCSLHPIGLVVVQPTEAAHDTPYFQATSAVCSLPKLAAAAGASGFLNAAPDADGILRRVPLVAELGGRVYPSLALAAVASVTSAREIGLRVWNVNASMLTIDARSIPVDAKSSLLLRYRGEKRTFPYLSAADILNSQAPADGIRNRIVFVGTTALGTREVVATPLDTLFAGVEVQATVADNLLQQDFIRKSSLGSMLESTTVATLGLLLAWLVARAGVVPGLIAVTLTVATLWRGGVWLLSTHGVFVSPLAPTLGLVSAAAVMTFVRFTVERGRAETAGREKTAAQRLMVQSLLSLTETRDAETGKHSRRTQQYARLLAEQLAAHPAYADFLTPERIELLASLAPLHDIGKVGIPDHILNKPGALTDDELAEMRKHPVLGRDVILKAEQRVGVRDDATLAMAKDIVFTHHERWDGTGYPQGLRGTEIPIAGRIMAVVDVYDAAASRSLYRAPLSHEETVKMIVSRRGSHFDPAVVDAFERIAPKLKEAQN